MDRQSLILGTVLTVLLALTGFYAFFVQTDGSIETPEREGFENVTADADNQVVTASFYNRSIDIMYEDTEEAKMYLDYNRDGSFDYQFDVQSDGEYHNTSRTVKLGGEEFALYFKYIDYSDRTGDGEITLYKVKRP